MPFNKVLGEKRISDSGMERGIARLTPEKIEKAILRVTNAEAGARLKLYSEICVRCGLCSNACHYYLSHDKDPAYSPVGKVKRTFWEMLKNQGKVSADFIYSAAQLAYTECNLCRRCVMYCPFGIDTAYLIQLVRRICYLLGVTPQYIQDTAHSHSAVGNQMWVKDDEWIDSLQWQEEEAREEIPNLRIPLEKEGADILYSVIAPEPKFQTQLIYLAAVIMNETGMDWTMPATPGWDNSDMAMFTGDFEMMGRPKRLHFETAQRLKVNRIVMGECGHAFRSVYDVGNRWLGWRWPPVKVVHAVEFYWELLNQGKLKVAKKIDDPITVHDPCNISRGQGLHDKAREIARAFCNNVIEMHPNREHNICCCAGGGVINCGPPFKIVRLEGNKIKADQLKDTGAKLVIAPCHNCHHGLKDIIKHYQVDMGVKFFSEIIYNGMEKSGAPQS
ncbi:MAG: (Fe-S)-binding protein [Deltaproteobacteria bacterium]|nr:(Fe-S)-binding protein [Deltaproteobacteria bacterium]